MAAEPRPALRRAGVTLVGAVPPTDETLIAQARACGERAGGVVFGPDGETLSTVGFDLGGEMSAVTLRRVPSAPDVPVDLAFLLGAEPVAFVRLESVTRPNEPVAAERAERLLIALAAALADLAAEPVVVCDDIGAVYELAELRRLAARGLGRSASDAFAFEAARYAEDQAGAAGDDGERDEPPPRTFAGSPGAGPVRRVIPVLGSRVPVLTWAAALETQAVGIVADGLAQADRRALRAAGVPFGTLLDPPLAAAGAEIDARRRDELDCYGGSTISPAAAAAAVEGVALEAAAAEAATGAPSGLESVAIADGTAGGAEPLATFAFAHAQLTVHLIDRERASARLARALGARGDVALLVGGTIRCVLAIELVGEDGDDGTLDLRRADALSVVLAAAFAERFATVAAGLDGALYGTAELARLAAARSGRETSWSASVAAATR